MIYQNTRVYVVRCKIYIYIKSALLKMIPRVTTTECMLVLGFCVKWTSRTRAAAQTDDTPRDKRCPGAMGTVSGRTIGSEQRVAFPAPLQTEHWKPQPAKE